MRWQALFEDLEAQWQAAEAAELSGEVAERSRIEAGRLRVVDRLTPACGSPLVVATAGAGTLHATLLDVGVDWLLLDEGGGRELLVPLSAVVGVTGHGTRSAAPGQEGEVARRLDLRWALRGLARGRDGVAMVLRDGSTVAGTLDRVGADHVELAEHAPGEPRRTAAVRAVRLVPLAAVAVVRRP